MSSAGGTAAPGYERVEEIATPVDAETEGPDRVLSSPALRIEQVFGRGFELAAPAGTPAGARTFGHGGAGGTTAFADVDRRLAFGYSTNRLVLGPPGSDARASALVEAVYQAHGA